MWMKSLIFRLIVLFISNLKYTLRSEKTYIKLHEKVYLS